jgi:CHASE2 domain-containing sensor protein
MNSFQNAFISYGRADSKAFATHLHNRLVAQGLKIWFDQNDIPLGVNFQNQIDEGIQKADNFIFIIAPHSINSPYCRKEIDLAVRLNKRIIPLLHVEQITQETWQERNPEKDLSEWEAYKAKGLHSSYPNMHPVISKINWVYLREGIDDFEKSFAGLLEIFTRHQEYVSQHTYFLHKALTWEIEEKQSRYLLVGEERIQAENWLKVRFKEQQPPCEPTDLHCAFICESTKNANNLMTQVFLSYADQDREFMEKIAKTLMRESFTVWTNKTDIQSGVDFVEAIYRGIEEADNVVYLMSADSLQSEYCQRELNYALSLNKRIIPLLIKDITVELIPAQIRNLQFINFIDGKGAEEYDSDVGQLINTLQQNAAYYEQHKIILAKAWKWERQKRNPNILLRGYNLRSAEAWLKVAKQKNQHQPTPLQEEFITQSLKQLPESTLDVFICYSLADSDFARKLNETLQIQNKTTWFDQESIASGSEFEEEIYQGIESANNFLFIISPNSVNSPYRTKEIEYAMKLNKRIVPVLYREVDPITLHPGLAKVQGIDFNHNGGDFLTNFGELTRTLDTDPDYMRSHTRLLLRAKEWEQQGRDDSFLLRGKDLVESEKWLNQAQKKEPAATDLQLAYINASHALPYRKIQPRKVLFTSLVVTALIFGARFFGLTQSLELATYDQLMWLRPDEKPDDRFLIVEINQETINKLQSDKKLQKDIHETQQSNSAENKNTSSLDTYDILAYLINKISQHEPRIIALNFEAAITDQQLKQYPSLKTEKLILQCEKPDSSLSANDLSVKSSKSLKARSGAAGMVDDDPHIGRFVRRDFVMQKPDPKYCDNPLTFSLLVAINYLKRSVPNFKYTLPQYNEDGKLVGELTLNNIKIPRLQGKLAGGYNSVDKDGKEYNTMLNYRIYRQETIKDKQNNEYVYRSPNMFAKKVNLFQILKEPIAEKDIKNKIVLIGTTGEECDSFYTPYGNIAIPSVTLQAQMISQMISAVLDNRRLIWWLSLEYQTLWIFSWSLAGGIIFWRLERIKHILVAVVISISGLCITCYLLLWLQSGWIPLVPPMLAFLSTGVGVLFLTYRLRKI